MRKGLLITGAVIIILGVVIFFIGIYLSSGITSGIASLVTGIHNETMISPGSSIVVNTNETGAAVTVVYNDTLGKPLQVITSGPGQLEVESVEGQYVVIYVPEASPSTLSLVNNYSENAMVYYTYGAININTLMPLALSTIISIGLIIVGIILLILGAVLKSK
ncbi:MAG: hypothetical protein ACP5GZ_00070 [Vulcanisaeta sp.]|jgi:hypothetical protein|nr:hypothetical protein [Vulcanisaeta moutnovskia]